MIFDSDYDPTSLKAATAEEQLRVIEAWFRYRYEDPAHRMPYDSEEGGYIWISGGPYNAQEQLEVEFQGILPDEVIEKLADTLESECFEWAPTSTFDEYDTELYEAVRENAKARATLDEALGAIGDLLSLDIAEPGARVHRRLLFANTIAALESFLSDTFINRVLGDDVLLQRYLETERAFEEQRFPLKDALRKAAEIKAIASKKLIEMVWHNIPKVKRLYEKVIYVDLGDIGPLEKAINLRHDIVHRNGRQKDGRELVIEASDIAGLIEDVRLLAIRVDLAVSPEPGPEDSDFPF
jgi:hypothetical protein